MEAIRRRRHRARRENDGASCFHAALQLAREWSDVLPFVGMALLIAVSSLIPLVIMRYWKDVVEESRRGIPWSPWYERDLGNGYLDEEVDNPRILVWSAPTYRWESEKSMLNSDEGVLKHCPVRADHRTCFVTRDRNYLRRADAILFDASSVNYYDVPTYRHKGQVWVIMARGEEASNDLRLMTAQFNWTMSQRKDADVIMPYKTWATVHTKISLNTFNRSFKFKSRAAVWLVSKCEADRIKSSPKSIENITNEFQFAHLVASASGAYIIEDCGGRQCHRNPDACLRVFQKLYYFVFIVDSSPCFEHPSHLLFDALQYFIIPVYFGRSRLGNTVPPMSVVDATAAPTVGKAVNEMNKIFRHFKSYHAYMTWKEKYGIITPKNDLCALCDALYENRHSTSNKDVVQWLGRPQECTELPTDRVYPKSTRQAKDLGIPIHYTFKKKI
ncbi:alpha-(1,3)-fucosyltransferase C-like [Dermacentor andersoni]|uniref:alpha-(1,3)-fucosyltransferase C-like n=1 Tax=Dermacentor andersoni TaxID=34620 RepID=UPI002155DE89|nr:alpha-(1,3)-fucosyltransferase C-like [Dermacentor andersoni]